jgi:hypothetical protein
MSWRGGHHFRRGVELGTLSGEELVEVATVSGDEER